MGWIIFSFIVFFIILIKILQWKKVCAVGFHDYVADRHRHFFVQFVRSDGGDALAEIAEVLHHTLILYIVGSDAADCLIKDTAQTVDIGAMVHL